MTYSKDWCQGFCRTCGTGCGQYSEEIFQLKKQVKPKNSLKLQKELQTIKTECLVARDACMRSDLVSSDAALTLLDTVEFLTKAIEALLK